MPFADATRPVLVRVHSECCTGDIFGSLRCDCGPQLEKALQKIEEDGYGVLGDLRVQELGAASASAPSYREALQERGVDTLDANLKLGLPVDSREYGTGAQILADLGITDMRLMSNNPKTVRAVAGYGTPHCRARGLAHRQPNPENIRYLQTKLERRGAYAAVLGEAWRAHQHGGSPRGGMADVGRSWRAAMAASLLGLHVPRLRRSTRCQTPTPRGRRSHRRGGADDDEDDATAPAAAGRRRRRCPSAAGRSRISHSSPSSAI